MVSYFQGLDCEPYTFQVAGVNNLQVFNGEEYRDANTREECEKRCLWLSRVQRDVCTRIFSMSTTYLQPAYVVRWVGHVFTGVCLSTGERGIPPGP